jgi:hypothetical protein
MTCNLRKIYRVSTGNMTKVTRAGHPTIPPGPVFVGSWAQAMTSPWPDHWDRCRATNHTTARNEILRLCPSVATEVHPWVTGFNEK